jgi:hypothetical protein
MITKAEAVQWRQAFIAQMPARLEAAIKQAAIAGRTSVRFNYSPATPASVDTFVTNVMTPAGWVCVNDSANSVLTVS